MYSQTTRSITVTVTPTFLEDQSWPIDDHYVWAYQVQIKNVGDDPVTLKNRYWHITDSLGRVQEVRGAGVVGEQPLLKAGESFEYTSGTPLSTASGIMYGSYEMETIKGELYDVLVPPFSLDSPYEIARPN